ncbi:Protein farnesyltransferase/geranylgeranyltransferase type-1 subunit alpha [Orchesella cincta]|uniref:Protein farnesyltransferase/geranylgeranyltransferase type-1 subunit alpha n=1 Tax=Orchesella cincta TaxID=48709 RepID=A0A1D2M6J9_ORCCI|nr:Protein farnesyltransferase/geranylgeranyltransferase type-1 subunit alpha [Orchesella cincta]
MSTSDDESNTPHVFYKDRPEWQDIQPIPSDEGPAPVVAIDYSEQFADVYNYIRGVINTGELSRRVLSLTCDAIGLNAANYTVWQLRRDVLEAIGVPKLIDESGLDKEFEKEFTFCEKMIENIQKNYQVWHHQKALVSWAVGYDETMKTMQVKNPEALNIVFKRELQLTKDILSYDAKNYHAWQHRQWILSIFKEYAGEMDYVNFLLTDDVRNNSAWNQRYFVFVSLRDFSPENLMEELDAVWEFVKVALSNESPWSYLRGLIRLAGDSRAVLQKEVVTRCKPLLSKKEGTSVPMLGLYIEFIDDLLRNGEPDTSEYAEVVCLLDSMISTIDPIRAPYWEYMKRKFVNAHADKVAQMAS